MSKDYFPSSFFIANREQLLKQLPSDTICVIAANGLLQRTNDVTYPFRQDSNFWYLTGLNEPDLVLVLSNERQYIIAPDRAEHHDVFDGAIDNKSLTADSGITEIIDEATGWLLLAKQLAAAKRVGILGIPGIYDDFHALYPNPARSRLAVRLRKLTRRKLHDVRPQLARLRMIKQSPEISAIEQAIAISSEAFGAVHKRLTELRTENAVQLLFETVFATHRAPHAYQPVIASGENACTIHYLKNDADFSNAHLLLIDAGAEYQNYASDITRTYALEKLTKREQAVADAVLAVQDFAFTLLRPGVTMRDYELQVEEYMGKQLKALGLISILDREHIRRYYPHATSHFLGLDTHDAADYQRPFEVGMVMTVEPGIYIPDESIGVRIEDNVVITKQGIKNLTENLPREVC